MDRFEHLYTIYDDRITSEKKFIDKIKAGEPLEYMVPGLESDNIVFALASLYLKHDAVRARQYFYNAAIANEYLNDHSNYRLMDTSVIFISYALLSDNEDLISRYARMRGKLKTELTLSFQICNAVQNIILGQWLKVENNIVHIERFLNLSRFKALRGINDVFRGMLEKDEKKILESLQLFLKDHTKRSSDPLIPRFISIDTSGLCKLAWRLGYHIDLHSEFVPIDLMPVNPLPKYETYDFLKRLVS